MNYWCYSVRCCSLWPFNLIRWLRLIDLIVLLRCLLLRCCWCRCLLLVVDLVVDIVVVVDSDWTLLFVDAFSCDPGRCYCWHCDWPYLDHPTPCAPIDPRYSPVGYFVIILLLFIDWLTIVLTVSIVVIDYSIVGGRWWGCSIPTFVSDPLVFPFVPLFRYSHSQPIDCWPIDLLHCPFVVDGAIKLLSLHRTNSPR